MIGIVNWRKLDMSLDLHFMLVEYVFVLTKLSNIQMNVKHAKVNEHNTQQKIKNVVHFISYIAIICVYFIDIIFKK